MIPDKWKYIVENCWQYRPEEPLFYTGLAFWLFFTVVVGLYSILYHKNSIRNIYLLIVSWFIYFQMNGAFLTLLVFSCLANYGFGLLISRFRNRWSLWLAVSFNVLLLGYFKYAYFVTDAFNLLFNSNLKVFNWLRLGLNAIMKDAVDVHSILLPIGVSFYTFQAISYVVDVYKRKTEAVVNPLDFSFYLSFFPQLVAGPIVRASSFIPQLYQKYHLNRDEFSHAVFLIVKGLLKKMVIADFLAINLIDRVFDAPMSFSGIENLFAVYAYSLQIYCDFSGYTDIAIGLALILGFKIPVNFNSPYKATGLTDFWHRWHISLSLWLRDYLYIPLGGNRKGIYRTHLNLLVTMVLGGLWHGANFLFIVWGAFHGLLLVGEKIVIKFFGGRRAKSGFMKFLSIVLTFQLVSMAWVLFRSKSFETVKEMLNQLKYHFFPIDIGLAIEEYWSVLCVFLVGSLFIWMPFGLKEKLRGVFIRTHWVIQGVLVVLVLFILSYIGEASLQPFIYFRF